MPLAAAGAPNRTDDVADTATRKACISMLKKAMQEDQNNSGGATSSMSSRATDDEQVLRVAAVIEAALYGKHGSSTSREYKSGGRSLAQNLRRNGSLRHRLLNDEISGNSLVDMDWQQLSTDEQRTKDEKVQERLMRLATLGEADGTEGVYTCSKCGSDACRVLDAGRRDIGKSETWGSSNHDNSGRVVTCIKCGHRWED